MSGRANNLESLLEGVAQGDRAAFHALYQAAGSALFSASLSLLKDRGRAEDILQEAFVRIWEKAATFDRQRGGAMTWMIVLTRRLAINELRRTGPNNRALDEDVSAIDNMPADVAEGDPIGKHRLKTCLEKLGEPQRTAVLLTYIHGYTNEELATRLGRPVGTIKSWLHRSLTDLRKCLG